MAEPIFPAIELQHIREIIKNQKVFFKSGQTRSIKFRKQQLKILKKAIVNNEIQIFAALKKDLNKPEFEAFGSEIAQVSAEIDFALKNIGRWTRPQPVPAALVSFPSSHTIYPQPFGVCYIAGAWNYPVLLSLAPVVGAIAAGNCAIVKPSELAANTAKLICELLSKYFDEGFLAAVLGGAEVSQEIIRQRPDYIFFTGSPKVGKIIMKAAAENLIPVTLELGGKSPCLIDEDANLKISARRVLFGKLLSGGQTCVAPDFLLVHRNVEEELLKLMKEFIAARYGATPKASSDLCRIINKHHFRRLCSYLDLGKIYHGGHTNERELYIEPTILTEVSWNDPIMNEEVFGPVLPVIPFTDLKETLAFLNEREKPLAAYYFGNNKKKQKYFIENLNFGGGGINDTIFHFGNPRMPVGGIGASGMGRYHGKYSFDTFSHLKSMVSKPWFPDVGIRYPPYKNHLKWLKMLFRL